MKILIGCEESQAVTKQFRLLGFDAFSCDMQDCSGGNPEWHIKGDIFDVYKSQEWDCVISFPPCTDLTVSGARHFEKKRLTGRQKDSINFFFEVWKISDAVENPIGILNTPNYTKKWYPDLFQEMSSFGFPFRPTQIIKPCYFGENATKQTCLWLKGLPKLNATKVVKTDRHTTKSGESYDSWWFNTCLISDLKQRAKARSKTFPGIAEAMADQWSNHIRRK